MELSINRKALLYIFLSFFLLLMSLKGEDGGKNYKVTFIELGSKSCIPCKRMEKVIEDLKKDFGGQVKFVFHDVWTDEGKTYGKKYKIRLIPTQVFLDEKGKEFFRHEGFFSRKKIVELLKKRGVR